MEISLSATADFTKYTYNGKAKILLDDHNDEYEAVFQSGDEFKASINRGVVTIIHEVSPKVKFTASTEDKKYIKLMRASTPVGFQFIPTPKYPQYPFIPNLTFELIPQLYEYLNEAYFNGQCPDPILFKKSTGGSALGTALYNVVNGRRLFRMLVNMKMIGNDMILFIDVLLHEMIHLYLYKKGLDENDPTILHDSHGPNFNREMNRLNKAGFNISAVLEWEKRDQDIVTEFHVLSLTARNRPTHAKYYWAPRNLEKDFDLLVAQVTGFDPGTMFKIELFATKDPEFRGYPQISNNSKIPEAKLKLWWKQVKVQGRLLKEYQVTVQGSAITGRAVKVPKDEEPYYAQPFAIFSSWLRKNKTNFSNDDAARTIWLRFPYEKIIPYAKAELIDINKALARGLSDAEIKRKLTGVLARFDDRTPASKYRQLISEIIEKHKLDALLQYPQLGI